MKVACEACNKAINEASDKYREEWKRVEIRKTGYSPLENLGFEAAILCPECLKTVRAFIFAPDQCQEQKQKEEEPDGEAIEH